MSMAVVAARRREEVGEVAHAIGVGERDASLVEEIAGAAAQIRDVPKRAGDQIRTATNIGKIREKLGYTPRTDIKSGLQKTVAWFQEQLQASADR